MPQILSLRSSFVQARSAIKVLVAAGVLLLIALASSCEGFFVDPALTAITITPPTPSIVQDTSVQMTATGTYEDGSVKNITGHVSWTTSDVTKVVVSSTGLATGISAGSATISASSANMSGSTTVGVTIASLVSIQVTPSTVSAITGQTVPFRATGTFAGGGTEDITDAVVWSADSPQVVISNSAPDNGQAKILGPFNAFPVKVTITATSGNLSDTATLMVTQ